MSQPRHILVQGCLGVGRAWHRLVAPPPLLPSLSEDTFCTCVGLGHPLDHQNEEKLVALSSTQSRLVLLLASCLKASAGDWLQLLSLGPSTSCLNVTLLEKGIQGKQFTDTAHRILRLQTDTDLWSRTRYIKTLEHLVGAARGTFHGNHEGLTPHGRSPPGTWVSTKTQQQGPSRPDTNFVSQESVGERYVGCKKGPRKTAFQENYQEFHLGKIYTLQNLFMLVTEILKPKLGLNKRIYSFCWFISVYLRAGETFMEISNTSVNFSVTQNQNSSLAILPFSPHQVWDLLSPDSGRRLAQAAYLCSLSCLKFV